MNTLLKPLQVRETLLDKKVRTFTARDFENIFRTSSTRAKYFLETQTDEGLLTRLKRGVYALKTDLPSAEEIANSLYKPSYISFEYALAYWGLIPEMPYAITSATTKPTRDFIVHNRGYSYFTIKPEAYTGYRLIRTNRRVSLKGEDLYLTETNSTEVGAFLMAEPEKALVDYLYFVSLGKKMPNDRLFIEPGAIDKQKLLEYAQLYDRKSLMKLVEDIV
jgi:predicted transcriptional regulator of viral defense system